MYVAYITAFENQDTRMSSIALGVYFTWVRQRRVAGAGVGSSAE